MRKLGAVAIVALGLVDGVPSVALGAPPCWGNPPRSPARRAMT
jgi:hypothetical protein